GHQRFCLIGVPHSRCRVRKATSDRWVARASPIGMLTRPKLMDPFQIVRMATELNSRGTERFRPPLCVPFSLRCDSDDRVPDGAPGRASARHAYGTGALAACDGTGLDDARL